MQGAAGKGAARESKRERKARAGREGKAGAVTAPTNATAPAAPAAAEAPAGKAKGRGKGGKGQKGGAAAQPAAGASPPEQQPAAAQRSGRRQQQKEREREAASSSAARGARGQGKSRSKGGKAPQQPQQPQADAQPSVAASAPAVGPSTAAPVEPQQVGLLAPGATLAARPLLALADDAAAPQAAGPASSTSAAAFGWSSPLADEVAKLQLSAAASAETELAAEVASTAAAAGSGAELVGGAGGTLPTMPLLGAGLLEPAQPPAAPQLQQGPAPALEPAPPGQEAGAGAAPGLVADLLGDDVITALPADLSLDLAPGGAQPYGLPPAPQAAQTPPPFPGGLFPIPAMAVGGPNPWQHTPSLQASTARKPHVHHCIPCAFPSPLNIALSCCQARHVRLPATAAVRCSAL